MGLGVMFLPLGRGVAEDAFPARSRGHNLGGGKRGRTVECAVLSATGEAAQLGLELGDLRMGNGSWPCRAIDSPIGSLWNRP